MPQSRFLEFLAAEAAGYPHFKLIMGANVRELVKEGGEVRGVRYRRGERLGEVRATLVVGADGRFSLLRKLAGFEATRQSPPMDVLWFRLPRRAEDGHDEGAFHVGRGRLLVMLSRPREWQIGYVFPKGGYHRLKAQGLKVMQDSIATLVPALADRIPLLGDWGDFTFLPVESSCLPRWHQPGLLLIGDAAHVMSPVGGVGINYAIGDAVEAANVLSGPLRSGEVEEENLAEVQRRRVRPTRFIQGFQARIQRQVVGEALDSGRPFRLPLSLRVLLRVPLLRALPARLIAFGMHRVRLEHPGEEAPV